MDPMDPKTLALEMQDGEEILAALDAESRAFEAKVAALKPGWVAPAAPAEEALEDHEVPEYRSFEEVSEGKVEPFDTVCLANVRISPVDWLWAGRIPRGMITLVEGDPGVGKSTFVADIVARHTTGAPFPGEGGAGRTPEKALWLTLEDSLEHTLKPRIIAAGGDPGMVEARLGVPILARAGNPDATAIGRLRETIKATGATLMVIDPGAATVEDANSEAIVRQAMGELFKVGQEEGVTTIWIRHLVKAREGKSALMAGGGSIGLAAAARSILQVLIDRSRKDAGAEFDRVVVQPKNNLDKEAPPYYFGLLDTDVEEDFMRVKVARASWAYEPEHGIDHYDVIEGINRYSTKERNAGTKARPAWADELWKEFQANGWALTTADVTRVLSKCGLAATKVQDLGTAGRDFRKTYSISWDGAKSKHVMHNPDGPDGE